MIKTPNDYYVVPRAVRTGVLVSMLEQLSAQRDEVKDLRDTFPRKSPEYGIHDASQIALKLAGNSQYGLLGATTYAASHMGTPCISLPNAAAGLAEGVTMYGRQYITAVRAWVEKNYPEFTVIYGDTDSLMIRVNTIKELSPASVDRVRAIGHEMVRRLNDESGIYPPPMKLDFEKIVRLLLQARKRYVGIMYSTTLGDTASKSIAQGNEVKRRDNPAMLPEALGGLLKLLIDENAPRFVFFSCCADALTARPSSCIRAASSTAWCAA